MACVSSSSPIRKLDHYRKDEFVTKIGYVGQLPQGIWVICQRTSNEKGGTWELDQAVVAPDGHVELIRQNRMIDLSYPVFYRPNFITDVIKIFGNS